MKSVKSLLALIMALCLVMCLTVPVFATEVDPSSTTETTTAATEESVDASEEASTPSEEASDPTEEVEAAEDEEAAEDVEEDLGADEIDDNPTVKVIHTILIVLEVIVSVGLIVIVLVQSGKESGLSGALTGNSDSYMSKNGKAGLDKTLAKATKWVALVWVLLTLALGLVSLL